MVEYSNTAIFDDCIAFDLVHPDDRPNKRNLKYKHANDHLCCSICQQPFIQPMTTTCGHTFCKECIYEFLKVQDQGRRGHRDAGLVGSDEEADGAGATRSLVGSCPLDRTRLDSGDINDLFPTPLIISNIVDELEVYCLNLGRGCQWSGCRWELDHHLLSDCGYTGVTCNGLRRTGDEAHLENTTENGNETPSICKVLVERRFVDAAPHIDGGVHECVHRIEECTLCQAPVTAITRQSHLDLECSYNYTSCKLCLNDMIPVKQLATHEANCQKVGRVKCLAHEIGCDWVGNSETLLEIHLNNNCQLSKLLPYMKALNTKVDSLSAENSLLQRQIHKILSLVVQGKVTNLGYHEPMEEISKFTTELSSIDNQDKLMYLNCEINRLKHELEKKILPYINRESTSQNERETLLNSLVNDNFLMKDDLNLQRALVNSLRKQLQFMLFTRNSAGPVVTRATPAMGGYAGEDPSDIFDIPSRSRSEERLGMKL